MSSLPAPAGPSGAGRCLLVFHPLAAPRAPAPESAPPASNPSQSPSSAKALVPSEGAPLADGSSAAAAAPEAGAERTGDPSSNPDPGPAAADAAPSVAAAQPPSAAVPPRGSRAGGSSASDAREDSEHSTAQRDPSPNPPREISAATRQEEAAQVLRGMALVDCATAESPFARVSAGFQVRRACPHQGNIFLGQRLPLADQHVHVVVVLPVRHAWA